LIRGQCHRNEPLDHTGFVQLGFTLAYSRLNHLFPGETPALLVDLRPFTINPDLSGAAGRATRSLGSDRRHQWYTPDFDWYSVLTTGYKRPNMPENGTKHADQNVIKYSLKPALYQA